MSPPPNKALQLTANRCVQVKWYCLASNKGARGGHRWPVGGS